MTHRVDPDYSGKRIVRWMEYIKTHDFSIGDYLVRHERGANNQWFIEKFSDKVDDDVWRKYQVTYKDEYGIPYTQKINMNGKLCDEQFPLVNVDLSTYRYEIDPDYETYILLGKENEYEPQGKFFHRWAEKGRPVMKALDTLMAKVQNDR